LRCRCPRPIPSWFSHPPGGATVLIRFCDCSQIIGQVDTGSYSKSLCIKREHTENGDSVNTVPAGLFDANWASQLAAPPVPGLDSLPTSEGCVDRAVWPTKLPPQSERKLGGSAFCTEERGGGPVGIPRRTGEICCIGKLSDGDSQEGSGQARRLLCGTSRPVSSQRR
jgi:hypothetical protein